MKLCPLDCVTTNNEYLLVDIVSHTVTVWKCLNLSGTKQSNNILLCDKVITVLN